MTDTFPTDHPCARCTRRNDYMCEWGTFTASPPWHSAHLINPYDVERYEDCSVYRAPQDDQDESEDEDE